MRNIKEVVFAHRPPSGSAAALRDHPACRQEEMQLEGLLSPSLQRSQDTAFAQESHPHLVGAL